jgi:hypothetical protein
LEGQRKAKKTIRRAKASGIDQETKAIRIAKTSGTDQETKAPGQS